MIQLSCLLKCLTCRRPLIIKYILIECRCFSNIRSKYFTVRDFFEKIDPNTIFNYLKDLNFIDLYNYLKFKYTRLHIYAIFIIYLYVIATFIYIFNVCHVSIILIYIYSISSLFIIKTYTQFVGAI